jgi:hypothetical protein
MKTEDEKKHIKIIENLLKKHVLSIESIESEVTNNFYESENTTECSDNNTESTILESETAETDSAISELQKDISSQPSHISQIFPNTEILAKHKIKNKSKKNTTSENINYLPYITTSDMSDECKIYKLNIL